MTSHTEPRLIKGGNAVDERGYLCFVNDFDFSGVKRFYQITNHSNRFIRAWKGHRREGKYVYVARGTALLGAVNLATEQVVFRGVLSHRNPSVLWIPPNHANGFMNLEPDTTVIFFSTSSLQDSVGDDVRFPHDRWDIWEIPFA